MSTDDSESPPPRENVFLAPSASVMLNFAPRALAAFAGASAILSIACDARAPTDGSDGSDAYLRSFQRLQPVRAPPAAPSAPIVASASAEKGALARLAAVSAAASILRGVPTVYGERDKSGRSPVLYSGGALPPPVRALPSTTGVLETDFEALVKSVQDDICTAVRGLEGSTGGTFREDEWTRAEGGGGRTRVLTDGSVFEKAAVNVSTVHGRLPPAAVAQMRARGQLRSVDAQQNGLPFFACGISLVLHPHNPFAPTAHANYRLFVVSPPDGAPRAVWFGGGADLTPAYVFPEDAAHFHGVLSDACVRGADAIGEADPFARFKVWADEYFASPHRGGERRGVGGIFFDDLEAPDPRVLLPFVADAARSFVHAYVPIIDARKDSNTDAGHKRWQALRRGRYVEFNLVHDRGTKFGLATPGARIESILVSLPLHARWEYMAEPGAGTPEAATLDVLKNPVDFL